MRCARLSAAVLAVACSASVQAGDIDSPRLLVLQAELARGASSDALNRFWSEAAQKGTPLIEPIEGRPDMMRVTFLAKGPIDERAGMSLGVFGVFNKQPWTVGDPFQHLPGTNVWYRSYELPGALRSPYLLIGDRSAARGIVWQRTWETADESGRTTKYDLFLDPFNRHTIPDVYFDPPSQDNVFSGPLAPPELPITAGRRLQGKLEILNIRSRILGNSRKIVIYLPRAGREKGQRPGTLLLFDGLSYRTPGNVPEILDRLIAERSIPPMAAVMVDFISIKDRQVELAANDRFADFVAQELMPMLRRRYRLSHEPARTIVGGASRGGLAAIHLALRYPGLFGNVIGQSSALWWGPTPQEIDKDWLAGRYSASPKLPVRFVLQAGSLEADEGMRGPNRRFYAMLHRKGYSVCYKEFLGGHTFLHWRMNLPEAVVALSKPGDSLECEGTNVVPEGPPTNP